MKIRVIAFSTNGCAVALKLKDCLRDEDVEICCKTASDTLGVERIEGSAKDWTEKAFGESDAIVFVGAIGIAVRYIAPHVRSKTTYPGVVGIDEHGKWAVALLSGHIGGCNELVAKISDRLGSEPIITTATDLNGKFSVDTFAVKNGLRISSMKTAQDVSVRVLDGRFVGFFSDIPISGELPAGLTSADSGEFGVCISRDPEKKPFETTLNLVPRDTAVGVGCRRGTDPKALHAFVGEKLKELGIVPERISCVASIDLKKDEEAVLRLARMLRSPAVFYSAEELNSLEGEFSSSEFVKSVASVDCVCERSAVMAGGESFVLRKTARDGMTLAVCSKTISPRFL